MHNNFDELSYTNFLFFELYSDDNSLKSISAPGPDQYSRFEDRKLVGSCHISYDDITKYLNKTDSSVGGYVVRPALLEVEEYTINDVIDESFT
jgi:hypothetical protein